MSLPLEHTERDAVAGDERPQELGALTRRRPKLQVGRSSRQGAGGQERAAQIRAATAPPTDDATRRARQGSPPCVQDPGLEEHREGVLASLDVQLVPGRAVEGTTPVGADLRLDPESTQERERAACDGGA